MDWTDAFMVHLFSRALFLLQEGNNPGFVAGTLLQQTPGVTAEQVEIAVETAVTATQVGNAVMELTPDQPVADALQGIAAPAPTVSVTGVARYTRPDGTAVFRSIVREFPWNATMAEITAEMNIAAVNWSAEYEDQFEDVSIDVDFYAP